MNDAWYELRFAEIFASKAARNFFIVNHVHINVRAACGSRVLPVVTYFIEE
jgi:hypothetical protein